MALGIGTAVGTGLSQILPGLANNAVTQMPAYLLANEAAPITGVDALQGTQAVSNRWSGLDLSDNPTAATAQPLEATEYRGTTDSFTQVTYSLKRYMAGARDLVDEIASEWQGQLMVDKGAEIAEQFAASATGIHAHKVFGALGTSGNWASGHAVDPGDITSAAFPMIASLDAAINKLIDAQRYNPGDPINVFIDGGLRKYLQTNSELKAQLGVFGGNLKRAQINEWIASYIEGAKCIWVDGRYKSTAGTVTRLFANCILVQPTKVKSMVTFALNRKVGPDKSAGIVTTKTKRVEEMGTTGGTRFMGDALFDHVFIDNTAGYLMYSLNS